MLRKLFFGTILVVCFGLLAAIPVYAQDVEQPAPTATERMLDKADQVLAGLIEAATKTGEFIGDQAPIVVRELVLFNTVKFGLYSLLLLGLMACFVWITYKDMTDWDTIGLGMAGMLGTAILGCLFVSFFTDFLKITLAPRVWLIEYAASLVR